MVADRRDTDEPGSRAVDGDPDVATGDDSTTTRRALDHSDEGTDPQTQAGQRVAQARLGGRQQSSTVVQRKAVQGRSGRGHGRDASGPG